MFRPPPQRSLRIVAAWCAALGFLLLLAYYEAFGSVNQDWLFAAAWLLMPLGLVGIMVATLWGWRRGEGSRPVWAVALIIVVGVAFLIMLFMAALASMFAF